MGINTLIVDDESSVLSSLTRLLEDIGCRVTTARDGCEAVETISRNEELGSLFDLVIADVNMPRMGGIELTKWVKRFCRQTKVILLSGGDKEDILAELKDEENTAFLKKPFSSRKLFSIIEARLGRCGQPEVC